LRTLSSAVAFSLLVAGAPASPAQAPRLNAFLKNDAGFTSSQWAALDRGEVIVRELPTGDRTDVAVIGIARTTRPPVSMRNTLHLFAAPASLADVATLRFKQDEIHTLSDCRPDHCNMKLSAADMAALKAIVEGGANVTDRATDYFRHRLVDMVSAFRRSGDNGTPVYDDNGSVQSGRSFAAMMARSCRICRAVKGDTSAARIFWVMDSMPRVRPTLRVMQELTVASEPGVSALVARQVYANHYFEAGLEMLVVVDDAVAHVTSAARGTLVISIRLYHFDQIPKIFIFDLRARVVERLEDAVVADLRQR
jgi:hypothetical protein